MKLLEAPVATCLQIDQVTFEQSDDIISRRLLELGFIPGAIVEIHQRAPITKNPIAVLVRGMVVALREYEANRVEVSLVNRNG